MDELRHLIVRAQHEARTRRERPEGPGAFGQIVRRFQDMAFGCAYAVLGDAQLAEDAAQEAFLAAWLRLDQLDEPAAFPGWLRRIVLSQCSRITRRARPARASERDLSTIEDEAPPAADALEGRQLATAVWEQLERLTETQRSAVTLFYVRDYSQREVAEFLQVPVGTVKKRLHDARTRLRENMIDMAKEHLHETRPSKDERFERELAVKIEAAMQAAAQGDAPRMAKLLEDEATLAQARGKHPIWSGEPQALHVAAERGHVDVVRALLDAGADPSGDNAGYDEWSPLMLAAHGGRIGNHPRRDEIVRLLIERGAEVDAFAAALLGMDERLSALLAEDPGAAARTGPAGACPLHFASTASGARALIAAGAPLDEKDGWGNTPLERAAFHGAAGREVANALLEHGARTHPCIPAALGDAERMRALLDAEPESIGARHKVAAAIVGTPLHAAAQHGHAVVARLLLERGADPNARADAGQTPLHCVSFNSSIEVAEMLIDHGADLAATDDVHQTTPAVWARFAYENLQEDEGIARMLEFLESRTP